MTREQQTRLWEAINRYVVACGGDPAAHVYGNRPRQDAVIEVEDVVREAIEDAERYAREVFL